MPTASSLKGTVITKVFAYSTYKTAINVTTSKNSTWKLYKDKDCKIEIKNKIMYLRVGETRAYIKVTSQDGKVTNVYTVTIKRNKQQTSKQVTKKNVNKAKATTQKTKSCKKCNK